MVRSPQGFKQSRFIALLDDFDRTKELMDIAADSAGKADEQFAKYADTMEYKLNQLSTEWEKFKTGIIEESLFKNAIDSLTEFVNKLNQVDFKDKFNIGGAVANIGLMIVGITKSISLMKTMASSTSSLQIDFKKKMPDFLQAVSKKYYVEKGKKLTVQLEPVLDQRELNRKLNEAQQYLSKIKNDKALKIAAIPQMTMPDQMVAELSSGTNASYKNIDKILKEQLPTQQYKEYVDQLRLLKQEMEAISGKSVSWGEAFEKYRQTAIQNAEAVHKQTVELELLEAEEKRATSSVERAQADIDKDSAARQRNTEAIKQNNIAMEQLENKSKTVSTTLAKFASGGLNLLNSALSTSLTYLPMMASGMISVKDAGKMWATQMGVMVAQQGLLTLTTAAQAAMDKYLAASNKIAAKSFWELMAAELGALAPLYLIIAAIAAAGLAIAGIIYACKKWADAHDEVKIATKQLAEEEEKLKKIQEQRVQTKAEKNSTRKELEETEKLKDEWIELSQVKNKTTEQQEQESKLIEEVKEKFPEIINYYDEVNNKLDLSIEKWEKIIEKQKEAAGKSARIDYVTAIQENKTQYNKDISQANVDYLSERNYWNEINETRKNAQKVISEHSANYSSAFFDESQIRANLKHLNVDDNLVKVMEDVLDKKLETTTEIIDALFDESLTMIIQVKAEKAYKEYQNNVKDIEKNYKATDKLLLSEYINSIEDNIAIAEVTKKLIENNNAVVDYFEEYGKYSGNIRTDRNGQVIGLGNFSDLTSRSKDLLKAQGIETEDAFKEAYTDQSFLDLIKTDIETLAYSGYIKQAEKELGSKEAEILENALTGSLNLTQKELIEKADTLEAQGGEINKAYAQVYRDLWQDLNDAQDQLGNIYGRRFDNKYGKELKSFADASQGILDTFGADKGGAFLSSIGSTLFNLGPETAAALLNENFYKNYNPLDEEAFENSIEKVLTETANKTKEEADKIFDDLSQKAKDSGIISDQINVGDIEAYAEKAIKVQEAFKDVREELYNLAQQGKENVVISADQLENYEKLEAALKEAGVSDVKLLNKETGEWTLNVQKANELLEKYGEDAIQKLRDIQGKEALEMIELERRVAVLDDEEKARYAALLANSKEYEKQIELIEAAADKTAVMVNYLSQISALSGSVSGALSNFVKNKILSSSDIASLQKGFAPYGIDANQFINRNLGLTNPEQLYRTALTQLQNAIKSGKLSKDELLQAKAEIASLYAAWIDYLQAVQDEEDKLAETEKKNAEDKEKLLEKITEAEKKLRKQEEKNAKDRQKDLDNIKKAEEDVVKAQEEYQKQLETIEEKQKAINDAIEKYNELLYGSVNRKGKLDIFYNYEQAISSLNDTLSRTEEKLGSAQDINAAVDALSRYTTATRNLIATEKAKQVSIQAGLANYANMIENGTASYTNRETGQQIGIRFGDYARKDQATGKYILNQRLLNQASFNDSFKDLIEENIETYNKYLDEYNKIEDEVAKKEKELQDKRKQALKQYSEFEKTIAEALKAQYEDEVEDLKDKYDSMKAADDDYLSALEDAINKQRQLREKEQKYEDLAEQEKKLSLLQRDTSGSRTLDVNKLRKDVEKTRKQLLDEAVDEVVDGLKKLAKENEETRQVEMELKDAIIQNTNHWNWQAEAIAPTFTDANSYANYMAGLNPEFQEMSFAQQQVQLEEYKEQFSQMVEYQAWNLLDATSKSGDAIIDIIDVSGETIMSIVSEKTTAFSEEVIRSYNEISQKVQDDLKNSEEAIDNARDALQDAIDKLDELQEKINEAIEKVAEMQKAFEENEIERQESVKAQKKEIDDAWKELREKDAELAKEQAKQAAENSKKDLSGVVPSDSEINPSSVIPDTTSVPNSIETTERKYNQSLATHPYHSSMEGKTLDEMIEIYNNAFATFKAQKQAGKSTTDTAVALSNIREVIMDLMGLHGSNSVEHINTLLDGQGKILLEKMKFARGGLVNYTGPAWVDGTPTRPEAFLSAADTKAIGDAVRILSDLSIIRDYDNLGSITNNTVGDTSIEINLNIESLSSEIDIDNMLERVKEEIVSVANPIGINTILKQS